MLENEFGTTKVTVLDFVDHATIFVVSLEVTGFEGRGVKTP